MRRRLIGLAAALAAPAATGATAPMSLGVNVHFGQGWPETARLALLDSGAAVVREAIAWRRVETTPGRYGFTGEAVGHLDRLCADGRRLVLVTPLAHPGYDGGRTVFSPAGRTALARFLGAVAARYRDCLLAIEIGNEVNIPANVTGPAAADRVASHVALLQAVYPVIKAAAPAVAVLGGSANSVATGFERALADAGMLAVVDGVAVHPYRADPTNLDWELARLQQVLAARGPFRPLWLTEFSKDFAAGEDAAAFLVRMAAQMSAAGVAHAGWYALIDQPHFPTMGLYTAKAGRKPAADAFAVVAALLARGPAVRIGDDPTLFHYRFGQDRQLLWGAPRAIRYAGAAVARDARGRPVPLPDTVSAVPVIIEGEVTFELGTPVLVADSLSGYGRPPWRYLRSRPGQAEQPLTVIDWNWTSYVGPPTPGTNDAAAINQHGLVVPPGSTLVARWTVPEAGALFALACVAPRGGAAGRLVIRRNGAAVADVAADGAAGQAMVPVAVAAGDRIDFAVSAPAAGSRGNFGYRFQFARAPLPAPDCRRDSETAR